MDVSRSRYEEASEVTRHENTDGGILCSWLGMSSLRCVLDGIYLYMLTNTANKNTVYIMNGNGWSWTERVDHERKRVDRERKMMNRRLMTHIGKYLFVNSTIQLWNRLPAEILGTLSCKSNAFRNRVRKVTNVLNWKKCVLKTIQKVKWSEV